MNIKNNDTMKKTYMSPETKMFSCAPCVIAASLAVGGGGNQWGEGDFEGEAANKQEGSWSDIWNNM